MTPSAQRCLVSSTAASGARPGSHSPTWVGPGTLRLSGGSARSGPVGIRLPPGTPGTPALGCGPAGEGLSGWGAGTGRWWCGMVHQPWEADELGSSWLWGLEDPPHAQHPGGEMLRSPGCETRQKFWVQK